ncbi:sucraseferredoxin family protein [Leptolyngbya sp. Heron Island J]|uniref:sucrase ferredoxin n=1 Tax=Leptolyngbya sp. Heron Island J TaxID=1385935 RepID=UPI0003B98E81|nr:sucrase ferredoxin [Leptolyngbya sp. Heron Island J]ESA37011.1 sucraseferredoxin family protein [Leptolyngbya sp. Heron Island J]
MSAASFALSESLIGTAVPADTFILLETPQPWEKPALLSPGVPETLRQLLKPLLGLGVRVHLIANQETPAQTQRRMLIFQRSSDAGKQLEGTYKTWEIQVDSAAEMAPALAEFWQNNRRVGQRLTQAGQRHLMICTHASHNECCGLYGYPFYQDAIATIQQLGLTQQVHPWQISHIGGHRFAPTLIDFPQGRYYGNLNQDALHRLLTQQGDIEPLLSTYRGWSLLPKPLQILEAELFKHYQWEWLQAQVAGHILNQNQGHLWAELRFQLPKHGPQRYTAEFENNKLLSYQPASDKPASLTPLMQRKTG